MVAFWRDSMLTPASNCVWSPRTYPVMRSVWRLNTESTPQSTRQQYFPTSLEVITLTLCVSHVYIWHKASSRHPWLRFPPSTYTSQPRKHIGHLCCHPGVAVWVWKVKRHIGCSGTGPYGVTDNQGESYTVPPNPFPKPSLTPSPLSHHRMGLILITQ